MKDHKNIMNPKSDKRPAIGGWCDGEYSVVCIKCKDHFIGDKRSYHCADCAYKIADDYEAKPKVNVWKITLNETTVYDKECYVVVDEISEFLDNCSVGDMISITKEIMTVEDYEKLPEFQGF